MVFQIWDNDKFSFDDFLGEHHFRSAPFCLSGLPQNPCCMFVCLSQALWEGWQEDQGAQGHWSLVLSEVGDTE